MKSLINNEYYLMHKDIIVCLFNIDEDGNISNIQYTNNTNHIPLGGQMNDMKFHEWWKDRAIPKTRHGAKNALQKLGYKSTNSALINNLALSLNDCYWIKPRNENLRWPDVNLFTNDFVDEFGEITINSSYDINLSKKTKFDCASSQGELQKKWCIDKDGRRLLIKGNYGDSYQQSLNEVFASKLHFKQGFKNYTEYKLVNLVTTNDENAIGCMSYNFCNENVESISAWELLQSSKIRKNESLFYPFRELCLLNGIKEEEFDYYMDYLIMSDYLLSNTDRHMNNISIIRDPNSLKLIGFSPIYDSGNSMFYDINLQNLKKVKIEKIETHSFIKKEIRLLKYVKNRNALDLSKINNDFSIYEKDIYERQSRIPYLKQLYEQKQFLLAKFQKGEDIWKNIR